MWESPQHRLCTESIQIVIVMLASEQKKCCLREVNYTSLLFDIKGKKLRLGILSTVAQPMSPGLLILHQTPLKTEINDLNSFELTVDDRIQTPTPFLLNPAFLETAFQ